MSKKLLNTIFLIVILYFPVSAFSQSDPVMYFCEKYNVHSGEIGMSNRFTTGLLTMVVESEMPLTSEKFQVQYDKYDSYSKEFSYFKKFSVPIKPNKKYCDLKFSQPGIYRVFLLDSNDKPIASALIEIVK